MKGAPAGCLPPRRGGASVSEHIMKSLTTHRVDIFNIGSFHAFSEQCVKGRNENVTIPKSVLKIGFKIDPIEVVPMVPRNIP